MNGTNTLEATQQIDCPFQLHRLGTLMEPEPGNAHEAEGVLNPAAARGPDGHLYLFPRLVAKGNYSRIGIARVLFNDAGDPVGVERLGIALEPEADYELHPGGGGCEDPRITYVEPIKRYVMVYAAFSAIGPRIAFAVSSDLIHWRRHGLATFEPYNGIDFVNVNNKDASLFPFPEPNHAGKMQTALLHRPLFPGTRPEETALDPASRQGMMSAIADIQAGRADTLICATLDRFSRDVEHQLFIKRTIEFAGGRIVFCDMNFEDSPEGELNFVIQGGFKQYEKRAIRARTMRGKRTRAEQGQQPQRSRPAFGYHIITNAEVECRQYPESERGHYVIVEENAQIVRRIFTDYVDGRSTLPKIAKAFNREGIPTPGNGRLWQQATIRVILTNPAYKGEPVSGRQKCHTDESRIGQPHKWTGRRIVTPEVRLTIPEADRLKLSAPPIVSVEMWEEAQKRLEDNRTSLKGNPRQVQMLSGRTVCPHCGERTVLKYQKANGKKYRYFVCGNQRKAGALTGDKPCSGDLYPVEKVEEGTISVLNHAWSCPESIAMAEVVYLGDAALISSDTDDIRKELRSLDAALDRLKQEEAAAIQAQIAGIRAGASPDAYREIFADIASRRKDLEDRRGVLSVALSGSRAERQANKQSRTKTAVQTALVDAARVLTDPDVPGVTKRDILMSLVDKVVCHKDGVEVHFLPGLFDGETGENSAISNCYTTCIGINTQK
jgi:DNA invertase Pin-like site-specific DNA recombinase